jgi:hypothetical protein
MEPILDWSEHDGRGTMRISRYPRHHDERQALHEYGVGTGDGHEGRINWKPVNARGGRRLLLLSNTGPRSV